MSRAQNYVSSILSVAAIALGFLANFAYQHYFSLFAAPPDR